MWEGMSGDGYEYGSVLLGYHPLKFSPFRLVLLLLVVLIAITNNYFGIAYCLPKN